MPRLDILWADRPWQFALVELPDREAWDPLLLGEELRAEDRGAPRATLQAMLDLACRRAGIPPQHADAPVTSGWTGFDLRIHLPGTGSIAVAQPFLDRATHEDLAESAVRVTALDEACRNHIRWRSVRYPIGGFSLEDKHVIRRQARLRQDAVMAAYRGEPPPEWPPPLSGPPLAFEEEA
jgi:hypothetical protein